MEVERKAVAGPTARDRKMFGMILHTSFIIKTTETLHRLTVDLLRNQNIADPSRGTRISGKFFCATSIMITTKTLGRTLEFPRNQSMANPSGGTWSHGTTIMLTMETHG